MCDSGNRVLLSDGTRVHAGKQPMAASWDFQPRLLTTPHVTRLRGSDVITGYVDIGASTGLFDFHTSTMPA